MTAPVRIPADIDREDRLIGNLTARQLAILATTGALLYALWMFTDRALPVWSPAWAATTPGVRLLGFVIAAAPIAVAGLALTLGRRDGMPIDRLLIAAARQRLATPTEHRPAHRDAPGTDIGSGRTRPGRVVVPHVPARAVRACAAHRGVGVVDLGRDGLALICAVTPISLTLRSPAEQDQLVAGMTRWLHSLTRPVQILVRTTPLDLTGHIDELHEDASRLGHPALAAAARAHAEHLTNLAQHTDLLRRRIYLVFHEPAPPTIPPHPHPDTAHDPDTVHGGDTARGGRAGRIGRAVRAAEQQLLRRAEEADQLLGPIGARVTPLDPTATAHALHAATNPDQHLYPPLPAEQGPAALDPEPAIPEPAIPEPAIPGRFDLTQPTPTHPPVQHPPSPGWLPPPPPPAAPAGMPAGEPATWAATPFRWWPQGPAMDGLAGEPLDGHLINPAAGTSRPAPHHGPAPRPSAQRNDLAGVEPDDEQIEADDLTPTVPIPRPTTSTTTGSRRAPAANGGRPDQAPAWSWAPAAEAYYR